MKRSRATTIFAAAALMLSSCGGGGGGSGGSGSSSSSSGGASTPTNYYAVPAQEALTTGDVGAIIAQAAAEAQARGKPAIVAVVDRVGNVLALFNMNGAPIDLDIRTDPNDRVVVPTDIEGLKIPGGIGAGALAKAITGAYLSSDGNAFTTRTASEIVQQHFPPAASTAGLESGPLFGVQFSQLPCSDLATRFLDTGGAAAMIGPKRSPLGLAADAGGMPLYKNGVLVGGIGVMSKSEYTYDTNIQDVDTSDDEYIALAGEQGFAPPSTITADRIAVDGTSLRFSDATVDKLQSKPASAPGFAAINGSIGGLVALRGYFAGTAIIAGTAYGSEASGIRKARTGEFDNPDAFVLTDGAGNDRFPIRAATDAGAVAQPLTQAEVTAILQQAFTIMRRARAQIRQPLDSRAQVSISVVDTNGAALGTVRSPDAPIFGTDVSLQKARTAAFFSGSHAGTDLAADPSTDVQHFVVALRDFFGDQGALTGKNAFTDRANGNLSRPYFPDGQLGTPNGPLSRPFDHWSPFSTGLQSALILTNLVQHVNYILGASVTDTPQRCAFIPDAATNQNRLQNGIQIFPGSVPIYRGDVLIGGIGVSGDGIDQDDMISFLGLYNAGQQIGSINEAPAAIRADQLVIQGTRLRYVGCPFAPFLDTSDQNACDGK
ncbi:MAG: hypothetical protein JWO65_1815 [Sphingomonas bacterium]|nr:hypothetical protein [Sphingomonas bacterium]